MGSFGISPARFGFKNNEKRHPLGGSRVQKMLLTSVCKVKRLQSQALCSSVSLFCEQWHACDVFSVVNWRGLQGMVAQAADHVTLSLPRRGDPLLGCWPPWRAV